MASTRKDKWANEEIQSEILFGHHVCPHNSVTIWTNETIQLIALFDSRGAWRTFVSQEDWSKSASSIEHHCYLNLTWYQSWGEDKVQESKLVLEAIFEGRNPIKNKWPPQPTRVSNLMISVIIMLGRCLWLWYWKMKMSWIMCRGW